MSRAFLRAVTAALLFGATCAAAAGPSAAPATPAAPGFSGRWELLPGRSEVGKGRKLPKGRLDTIAHEAGWVDVKSRSLRDSGDSLAIDYRYRTDGESTNQVMGQAVRTVGRRAGPDLLFESVAKVLLLELKVRERWTLLGADTLVMVRDTDSPMGQEHQRLMFARRP